MGLNVRKLLETYFQKMDLQEALYRIDVSTSGNNDELIDKLLEEWEDHGKNKYDLFEILERPTLLRICKAYGLGNKGSKKDLIKKIKKSHLLDDDFIKPVIINQPSGNDIIIKKKPRRILGHNISDRGLTAIIAGGTIGLLIVATIPLWLSPLQCSLQVGVQDETYVNCPLGFHIARPNPDWSFNDAKNQLKLSESSGFLGGVVVQSPNYDNVRVLVFQNNISDIQEFRQNEIQTINSTYHITSMWSLPTLNEPDLIQVIAKNNNSTIFLKERVETQNGNIFVIQQNAQVFFDPLSNDTIKTLNQIYQTFGYK